MGSYTHCISITSLDPALRAEIQRAVKTELKPETVIKNKIAELQKEKKKVEAVIKKHQKKLEKSGEILLGRGEPVWEKPREQWLKESTEATARMEGLSVERIIEMQPDRGPNEWDMHGSQVQFAIKEGRDVPIRVAETYADAGYQWAKDYIKEKEKTLKQAKTEKIIPEKARYARPGQQPNYKKYIGPKAAKSKIKPGDLLGMSVKDKIVTGMVDSLKPLDLLEDGKTLEPGMSGYKSMNMLSNFPSIYGVWMQNGKPIYQDHWITFDPKTRGIEQIVHELGEDTDDFFDWLAALSAQELINNGRENLFGADENGQPLNDQDMVNEILNYVKPTTKWEAMRSELRAINKSMLDFAEQAGMINPEKRQEWERFDYLPFFRVAEDMFTGDVETLVPSAGKDNNIIHALKGSSKNIGDPLVNLLQGYSTIMNASLKNLARKKSILLALDTDLVTRMPKKPKDLRGHVAIRHNGKAQYFKVNDKALYDALVDLDTLYEGWMAKTFRVLGYPKRLLTGGVTIDPAFRVANFIRDTKNTFFLEKGFIPLVDSIRGAYHSIRNTDEFKSYAQSGGAFSGAYARRDIFGKSELDVKKLKKRLTSTRKVTPLKWWEKIGEASENAARVGAYLRNKKAGMSSFDAAYSAKDLLDFHKHGKWAITRAAIQLIPFLNARLQGLYKLGRTGLTPKTAAGLMLKATMYSLTTMALLWSYDDDDKERFNNLPDYEKRMYNHFWIGDWHFRIPVPFEIGSIFSAFPTALYEWWEGSRSGREVADFAKGIASDTFMFNPIPQALKPVVEWVSNKDFFTGKQTVPDFMKDLPGRLQYDNQTSKLAIEAGKVANISPAKMDKFMKDVFAYNWYLTKHISDVALTHFFDYPSDPAEVATDKWLKILGAGRFWDRGAVEKKYNRQVEQFYKMKQEVDATWAEFNYLKRIRDIEGRRAFKQAHRKEIQISKMFAKTQQKLSKLNQRIRLIELSNKTPKQKQEEINKLVQQRNEAVKRALERGRSK